MLTYEDCAQKMARMKRTPEEGYRLPSSNLTLHARNIISGRILRDDYEDPQEWDDTNDLAYVVKYHDTEILTYYPDGAIKVQSGGWYTMSTRDRIERFSGIRINQESGFWTIAKMGGKYGNTAVKPFVPYHDGIVILASGKAERVITDKQWEDYKKSVRLLRKRIGNYCLAFADSMQKYRDRNGPEGYRPDSDVFHEFAVCDVVTEKFTEWMTDGFYPVSLAISILEERFPDPRAESYIFDLLGMGYRDVQVERTGDLYKTMYKYLKGRLTPPQPLPITHKK